MRENSSLRGGDINWNFAKFLVKGNGTVVKYYMPDESPDSIIPEILKLIG
jgi:glutathione peroxidase-family protein